MLATNPPEARRVSIRLPRPLWIGLAAAVLVVVAIALQFAMPIYRQQTVIREIERLGGNVQTRPRGPEWLRERFGEERMTLCNKLVYVNLDDTQVTNAWLAHLAGLTELRVLSLDRTKVTDEGLIHVKRMTDLEALSLNQTRITNVGLIHLQGLTGLRKLDLGRTDINDAGLAELKGFANLEELDLGGTDVTNAGLHHLRGLTSLRRLVLRSVLADKRVTRAGIAELRQAMPLLRVSN